MKKIVLTVFLVLFGCEGASLATHGATWGLSQWLGYARYQEATLQRNRIEAKIDALLIDQGIDTAPIVAMVTTGKKPVEPETPVLPWAGVGVGSVAVLLWAGTKKLWPLIKKAAEKYVEKEIG